MNEFRVKTIILLLIVTFIYARVNNKKIYSIYKFVISNFVEIKENRCIRSYRGWG